MSFRLSLGIFSINRQKAVYICIKLDMQQHAYTAASWVPLQPSVYIPTDPCTIREPKDQEIGEMYVVQERRPTDFDTSKGRSGYTTRGNVEYTNVMLYATHTPHVVISLPAHSIPVFKYLLNNPLACQKILDPKRLA